MLSSTPKFKVALSTDFFGDPAGSIHWIKAMRAYFAINSKLYSTNEIKIMTTMNKMSKGRGCYSPGSSGLNSGTLELSWESGVLGSAYVLPPC